MQEEEEDNSSLSKSKKKRELNDNTDVLYDLSMFSLFLYI